MHRHANGNHTGQNGTDSVTCAVCGQRYAPREAVAAALVREPLQELLHRERPEWSAASWICRSDLSALRARYVHSVLEAEKGELTGLEQAVLDSLRRHEILSANVDAEQEQAWTFGERLADRIASFGGSWRFLILFMAFIAVWIAMNSLVLFWKPADPYPYILLNLLLSCLAAVQAPVIMMSQNRQETRDRARAEHDYQINLKAELEIRHLHEKLDHLLNHQWERLLQIQEVQVDLLAELRRPK